jgi:small GTP-binding protein
MRLFRKWRKKRRLKYIPSELILEAFHETLKSFNEEIPILPEISKIKYPKQEKAPITKKMITIEPREKILSQPRKDTTNLIKILLIRPAGIGEIIVPIAKDRLFQNWKKAVGIDVLSKEVEFKPNQFATLRIWDIVMPLKFQSFRNIFFKGSGGAILFFDLTKEQTFIEVKKLYNVIKELDGSIPFILIGDNSYLPIAINREDAREFARNEGGVYIEIDSTSVDIVELAIRELTYNIITQKVSSEEKVIPSTKKVEYKSSVDRPIEFRTYTAEMYDATFKMVIFGEPEVPKAQLTQRFLKNLFVSDSKMTIGVNFEVKSMIVDNNKIKLQIWDFGGEERFRFLLPTYVRGAKGGFFVYDVSNISTLMSIDEWLAIVRKEIKNFDAFPIIVMGIIPELLNEREVPAQVGIKVAKSRGVDGFIECNVKTGENVDRAFQALTKLMIQSSVAF